MLRAEAILYALSSGNFVVTIHALQRMAQKKIFEIDIRSVGETCCQACLQSHGTWKVKGRDSHGRRVTVIVAEEKSKIIIVTVFGG